MPRYTLIVIGTSMGALAALTILIRNLPKDLNVPICIARHTERTRPSILPALLTSLGTLPVVHPSSVSPLISGQIFLAPPAHHIQIEQDHLLLIACPDDGFCPSIDHLFQSAATAFGPQVIAIILTGNMYDGTRGLQAVKEAGGITIIQDPGEASSPSMPLNAQAHCSIDYCLPLAHIAPLLRMLTGWTENSMVK